jgi:hypothetical protein
MNLPVVAMVMRAARAVVMAFAMLLVAATRSNFGKPVKQLVLLKLVA